LTTLPNALVVSDFPIIQHAVDAVFRHRYKIFVRGWGAFISEPDADAALIIADATTMDVAVALHLLSPLMPNARLVICSLHHNDVKVYRMQDGVYDEVCTYASLLEVSA
jgi:hypothetical protein